MAGEPLAGDSQVSYTVKELFDRLEGRLVSIDGKLDSKVERSEFVDWTRRADAEFDDLDGRVVALEDSDAQRRGISAWQTKTWVIVGSFGALAAAIIAAVAMTVGAH